jgi:aminopeptidase N
LKTIAHESCHQWWYNLVGNDEVDYPFLDEGLTCWSTDYYGEHYYGNWEYFQFTRYVDKVRTYYADTGLSSRINLSSYDYLSYDNWVFACYYKAPLILEKLRQQIGTSSFLNSLKLYYELYKFSQATLSDLQKTFQSVVGESLSWFFLPWFDDRYLPIYSFKSHSFDSSTNKLVFTIEDLNEPLNQYAYYQEIPIRIYGVNHQLIDSPTLPSRLVINGTTTFTFTLPVTPYIVELIYNDYVLVQFNKDSDSKLILILENIEKPFILGYDIGFFLIITMLTIGIIIVLRKRDEF